MTQAMSLLNLPIVLAVLQFGAGYLLKRYPNFPNQAIPVATYVMALFGYAVTPAEANAASGLAGLFGGGSIFAAALLQNLIVTGTHGTWKNTVFPALQTALGSIFKPKAG